MSQIKQLQLLKKQGVSNRKAAGMDFHQYPSGPYFRDGHIAHAHLGGGAGMG